MSKIFFRPFQQNADTHKDLVLKELIGFRRYPVDVENCKCPLSWWHKEQNKFPTLVILVRHILGIPTNQIET
jgi:hypothetical protein